MGIAAFGLGNKVAGIVAGAGARRRQRRRAERDVKRALRGIGFTVDLVSPPTPPGAFDVDRYRRRFERAFPQAVKQIVIPALRSITPVRSGRLRNSWRVENVFSYTGRGVGVTGRFYWIWTREADQYRAVVQRTMRQAARVAAARAARGL